MSSLSEDTTVKSDFGDDNGISRSCFSPPSIRKRKTTSSHSHSVKQIATASTQSSSGTSSSGRSGISGQESVDDSHDDQSHFSKQYENNSHHAYVAYFKRGDRPVGSLRLFEHPTPRNFPTMSSEIVVKVDYSTVSVTDCKVRLGWYWGEKSENPLRMPIVPGVSFTGTIVQISKPAARAGLRHGDRVTSLVRVGANSRHVSISKDRVVRLPPNAKKLSEIACLPEVVLGAFQALHLGQKGQTRYRSKSLSGKHVLVIDGTSVHGASFIELAQVAGATSVYATSKEKNHKALEAKGVLPLGVDPKFWFSLLKGRIDLVVGVANDNQSSSNIKEEHVKVLNKKRSNCIA